MIKQKGIITLCVILALAVCLGGAALLLKNSASSDGSFSGVKPDPNALAWDGKLADTTPETSGIKVPGYGRIYFPEGELNVPLTLCNPVENTCWFQFELYLDSETAPIFTSGYIEPGFALQSIQLSHVPQAGEHSLLIKINTQDPETKLSLNGAEISTILTVS